MRQQLWYLLKATVREFREHPALAAAVVMLPLGYEWRDHRWTERI